MRLSERVTHCKVTIPSLAWLTFGRALTTMNGRSRRGAATRNLRIAASIGAWILPFWVMAHGPPHEQIADLTEQIARDPTSASLYLDRGELHRHHRDWAAALKDYDRAQELNPRLTAIDYCRGQMLLDADRHGEALNALNRYIKRQPDQPDALLTRARVLTKLGQPLIAAQDFTRAIERFAEPQPEYYLERARALVSAGDRYIEQALRGLDEGLERLGQLAALQLYATELELTRRRYDAALARLEKAAARSPLKAHWLFRRGQILEMAERASEARFAYETALAEIHSLSSYRRNTKVNRDLEARLMAALERLP